MNSPSHHRLARPPSFSEGAISLPRVESSQKPLMLHVGSINSDIWSIGNIEPPTTSYSPPSPPSSTEPRLQPPIVENTDTAPLPPPRNFYLDTAHRWGIRFSMHLSLIAIFETLFFWHIVAQSEDNALTTLIGSYTNNIITSLANMSAADRNATATILNALVNIAAIDVQGVAAASERALYNGNLLNRSWTYFGGVAGLCALLATAAPLRRLPIQWSHVILENLVLVLILGLYEWMFFHTIVFQYRAVSIEELDRNIINSIAGALRA